MHKLSPSDFAYLYEECKHCFYLKIKGHISRPSLPFPSVFTAMNSHIQGDLIGKSLKTLSPEMPEGIVESQEGFVRSNLIPGTSLYISGKYDLLVKKSDGSYLLVDLKISKPSEEKAAKYSMQLAAYKFAMENPLKNEPIKISSHGLLILYPNGADFERETVRIDMAPTWFEVESVEKEFVDFMDEIGGLLAGPLPKENPNCKWCEYRHYGERVSHKPVVDDIPF